MSLPAPLHRLIGRDRERAHLRELLGRPDVRLITVTGLGGVGKTTLAVDVARDVEPDFPDGVVFVPLAAIADAALVAGAVARALGVVEDARQSPLDQAIETLREQETLLLLDNFEHVLPAATLISDLLRECAGLAVLVTSRMPMHLAGEHVLDIEPLPVPNTSAAATADAILSSAAVALFAERARAVRPDFTVTDQNAGDVAELCRRVDGLPLAIELIAARIAFVLPADIRAGSAQMLPWLSRGPRDAPERHQTMADAIGWSYDLLGDDARMLFCRLAVLPGGFTLNLVDSIWKATVSTFAGRTRGRVSTPFDLLQTLVEVRLVQADVMTSGTTRYRMLQTIREFGQSSLSVNDRNATCSQLASYLVATAEESRGAVWGQNPEHWFDTIQAEHENIRLALDWLIEQPTGTEVGLELCTKLWMFWKERGYLREAEDWLRRFIALTKQDDTVLRAHTLLLLGHSITDLREKSECYSEALDIYRRCGADRYVAGATSCLGMTALDRGQVDVARDHFLTWLSASERLGNRADVADAHLRLGQADLWTDDVQGATEHLSEAQRIWSSEELSDAISSAYVMIELAEVHAANGDFEGAQSFVSRALDRFSASGAVDGEQAASQRLAEYAISQGNLYLARKALEESLQLAKRFGFQHSAVMRAVDKMAHLLLLEGAPETAVLLWSAMTQARMSDGQEIPPRFRRSRDRAIGQARQALTKTTFDRIWLEGQLIPSIGQAVDVALARPREAIAVPRVASKHPASANTLAHLTAAQLRVLCLLALGWTDHQVADELAISVRTVTTHVSEILRRLDVQNRTQAALLASQSGICPHVGAEQLQP